MRSRDVWALAIRTTYRFFCLAPAFWPKAPRVGLKEEPPTSPACLHQQFYKIPLRTSVRGTQKFSQINSYVPWTCGPMNCRGSRSVRKIGCGRGKVIISSVILASPSSLKLVPERVINAAKNPKKLYSVDLCDLCDLCHL
jgi:hypothetical protein